MEFLIVLENQSSFLKYLKKIDHHLDAIYFDTNDLNQTTKDLIQYLANGQISENFWELEQLPKFIFTEQFSKTVILIIAENKKLNPEHFSILKNKNIVQFSELN